MDEEITIEPPPFSGKLQNIFPDGTVEYDGVIGQPGDFPLTPAELAEVASQNYQPSLDEKKRARILILKSACQAAIEAGFTSDALGTTHLYDSKLPQDQINIHGAAFAGIDRNFTCTDTNGVKDERWHTAAQLRQVFMDGALWVQTHKSRFWTLKRQVDLADEAEIESIIW